MKIKMQEKRGITLIALVVTIVIMLILSGVTINMVVGEGGVLKSAQDAKNTLQEDIINEQETTQNLVNQLNEIMNENSGTGDEDDTPTEPEEPELPDGWDGTKVTPEKSEDDVIVPVPNGFRPSEEEGEKNVSEGYVITDGTNEFVWIPVNNTQLETMYNTENPGTSLSTYEGVDATTDVYSNLRNEDGSEGPYGGAPGSTESREPDILTSTSSGDAVSENSSMGIEQIKNVFEFNGTDAEVLESLADMLVADYEASYASIKKYGGFYIGRYELTGSVEIPTVQKGSNVLTKLNWYQLYKACSGIVNTASITSAKTTMINGTQWDRVLEWLVETKEKSSTEVYEDSSTWGNYKNYNDSVTADKQVTDAGTKIFAAGASENWKANNIYDLAGNAYEWTQEASSTSSRVSRGGYCTDSGSGRPASNRFFSSPCYTNFNCYSARPVLYIAL